jgi:heptosyltransferase-2
MGDMLCVVPLLRALRAHYPGARIVLMTSAVNHEVMEENPYLDDTLLYDKRMFLGRWTLHVGAILRFFRDLRAQRFDQVIVPATVSMSFTSDLLALMSGAPDRVGARSLDGIPNPSGFVYTEGVHLDWRETPHRHQTLRNLDIVRDRGIGTTDCSSLLALTEAERREGRDRVRGIRKGGGRLVAFHPGAGKIANRWPAIRFASLANYLAVRWDAGILITAGPMDVDPVQSMVKGLDKPYKLIENQELRLVASILAEVDLLVSNDTGIMHVGAAVGSPVLSFFGPTDPLQWAPVGEQHRALAGPGGNVEEISLQEAVQNADAMLLEGRVRQ